jgi:hypothetical protein
MWNSKPNWAGNAMSREALSDFLRAVERHQPLRREATDCRNDAELIELARSHGFELHPADLQSDAADSRIGQWFQTSRLNHPFRSPTS